MIKKLWCIIWGHKIVVRAMTGRQFDTNHPFYPDLVIKGNYYVLRRLDFCRRCGEKVE